MNFQTFSHENEERARKLLSAALDYAAWGWLVFPCWWIRRGKCACGKASCQHPGKHPIGKLVPNGRNNATTDSEIIHRWWRGYPQANVAIATGPESGLVVVDVDPRNGGNKSFKKLPGNMPLTPTVHTGGGGEHYFLMYPGKYMKIKSTSEMGGFAGIDQKADGGYVVAPPSNHRLFLEDTSIGNEPLGPGPGFATDFVAQGG